MRKVLLLILILSSGAIAGYGQKKVYKDDSIKSVELRSILNVDRKLAGQNRNSGCLDLVTAETVCSLRSALRYGGLRVGNEWDWFQITMPPAAQTKMVSLGHKNWEDALKLPAIKPWPKLRPGERRSVTVDASGADGRDGANGSSGRNGDGSVSDTPASFSDGPRSDGSISTRDKSGYDPFQKAVKGNMYLVRVYDDVHDYYVLFRVDELKRGQKCVISWRKLDIPAEKRPPKF